MSQPRPAGPLDLVGRIIEYESGEMPDENVPEFFQQLIDTGTVWHLQGVYQRTARGLVDSGLCHWKGKGKSCDGCH